MKIQLHSVPALLLAQEEYVAANQSAPPQNVMSRTVPENGNTIAVEMTGGKNEYTTTTPAVLQDAIQQAAITNLLSSSKPAPTDAATEPAVQPLPQPPAIITAQEMCAISTAIFQEANAFTQPKPAIQTDTTAMETHWNGVTTPAPQVPASTPCQHPQTAMNTTPTARGSIIAQETTGKSTSSFMITPAQEMPAHTQAHLTLTMNLTAPAPMAVQEENAAAAQAHWK